MSDREKDAADLAALEEQAPLLAARVAEQLNQDPFWQGRLDASGQPLAEAVALSHLLSLREALEAGEPARFTAHFRGVRPALLDRGLSTRHLVDHLERLAEALKDGPLGDRAAKVLRLGMAGLDRETAQAQALEKVAQAAARLTLETLDASLPGWQQGWTDAPGPTPGELAREWTAFVVDAVERSRDEVLVGYFRWLSGHLAQRGHPARLAQDIRGALRYGFSAQQEAGVPAVEVLDAAESSATPPRAQ